MIRSGGLDTHLVVDRVPQPGGYLDEDLEVALLTTGLLTGRLSPRPAESPGCPLTCGHVTPEVSAR
jgi:hypothetical protein